MFHSLIRAYWQCFKQFPFQVCRRRIEQRGRLVGLLLLAFAATCCAEDGATATRSLDPPVFLPDGTEFRTWEPREHRFQRTLFVDQRHPQASDTNPGTQQLPFKTISRAAELLQPGERVVVASGIYREWVCPLRGGLDAEHLISYEAAPGAQVVIKGSEILTEKLQESRPWIPDPGTPAKPGAAPIRMVRLPRHLFPGYNPFAVCNYPQADEMTYWKLGELFGKPMANIFLQYRGLVFQDGRRLQQVSRYSELAGSEGAFWVETNGLVIHLTPFGSGDPNRSEWELTTREQIFSPEEYQLGYVRLKGFTLELAGNGFPFPQRGAVSTMHGHHWILEDNTIRWVNGVGMDIGLQGGLYTRGVPPEKRGHHIVRGNRFINCGVCGLSGPVLENTLIDGNEFQGNAWHDVEEFAECAALKTHQNSNVLVQRNQVSDTPHGTGIYLDNVNVNCRITRNVIVNTGSLNGPGPGTGGIYVEASQGLNWIDHNVVWNSTRTNGIYSFFISNLTVAHNLVGGCAGAGIMILDVGGRPEGNPGGGNQILNNMLVDNGWQVTLRTPKNISNHNWFQHAAQSDGFRLGSPETRFDLKMWRSQTGLDLQSIETDSKFQFEVATRALRWNSAITLPECPVVPGLERDFEGHARTGLTTRPGPFADLNQATQPVIVRPIP